MGNKNLDRLAAVVRSVFGMADEFEGRHAARRPVVEASSGRLWQYAKQAVEAVMLAIYDVGGWYEDDTMKTKPKDVLSDFVKLVASGKAPNNLEKAVKKAYELSSDDTYGRYYKIATFLSDYAVQNDDGEGRHIDGDFEEFRDALMDLIEEDCADDYDEAISIFMACDRRTKEAVLNWFKRNAGADSGRAARNVFDAMFDAALDEAEVNFEIYDEDVGRGLW